LITIREIETDCRLSTVYKDKKQIAD